MLTRFSGVRRGFTLIEMLTVTVIITVLASIVVGRLQNDRDGIRFQKGIQSIESSAVKARSQAIQKGQTYELTFDNSAQSLKVEQLDQTQSATSTTKSITSTSASTSDENSSATASLGNGWTVYEVRKPDGSTESDLSIKFFADGTAEAKSVEFHSGNAPVSLSVQRNGSIEVKRGSLADQVNQEWEAGNIEQRGTQQ